MLAFVFWHWPRLDVTQQEYEAKLVAFHQSLGGALPAGMRRSLTWRVTGAPWLPDESGYEDWYLLDSSAALDVINREAVSGNTGRSHDAAAALSGGGTSGLYAPPLTEEGAASGRLAVWFRKPAGMRYDDLYGKLEVEPGTRLRVSLWRRMLVLGPTPEFCLLQPDGLSIPAEWSPTPVVREPLWP